MAGPIAYTQVRYRLVDDDGPFTYIRLPPDATSVTLDRLERDKNYLIEARNVGPTGLVSLWVDLQQATPAPEAPVSPTLLTASALVNGIRLAWEMPAETAPTTRYDVERAPDAAGAPGAWGLVNTCSSTEYIDPPGVLGKYWYRVRAKSRADAYSAAYSNTASATLQVLAGQGMNLVPDPVSTYESTTLPSGLATANATLSRVTGYVTGALRHTQVAASPTTCYCEPTASAHQFQHIAGRKYIVSAYVRSSVALASTAIHLYLRGLPSSTGVQADADVGVAANTWTRVSAIVDASALTDTKLVAFLVFDSNVAGRTFDVDGLMVEELLGTANKPSTYTRGTAGGASLAALVAAQTAQATADGVVDIYRQSNAPTIGGAGAKVGDYWQDSDDGKWWYCNGSSWVEAPDARLPQVVLDAAAAASAANTAQTTANARIRLYIQEAQPSGGTYIVGDQWYQPSTKLTRYFNGTGWSLLADQAAAAVETIVLNPGFEQGLEQWTAGPGFIYEASTNAALTGTNGVVRAPELSGGNPNGDLVNNKVITVNAGQRLFCAAAIRNLNGTANGEAHVGYAFYDLNGTWIGNRTITYSSAPAQAGTTWRVPSGRVTAPLGSASARLLLAVAGHTVGYWCFDNARGSAVSEEVEAPRSGENMVANGNFSINQLGAGIGTLYVPVKNAPVVDGWKVAVAQGTFVPNLGIGLQAWSTGDARTQVWFEQYGGNMDPGYHSVHMYGTQKIAINASEVVCVEFNGVVDKANANPAGISYYIYAGAWCYDQAGTNKGFVGYSASNIAGAITSSSNATLPADTAYIIPFIGIDFLNSNAGVTAVPYAIGVFRPRSLRIRRVVSMDSNVIDNGTVYGKVANEDLYDYAGVRRIGYNVKGSRKIAGGARNLRSNIVAGLTAVRTTGALSANSSGQVTVNAHSLEIGGETVTYSSVSNAVVGLTQGVTYIIFTLDLYLDGGVRTYYAQTSSLSAQQAGEGAVMMGNITIPTSGTSGGGGGGGGIDPCVAIDMHLPDARYAHEVLEGDLIECWDEEDQPGVELVPVESNFPVDLVECIRIETTSGAAVVASHCTPMTLRNHQIAYLPDMLGEEVLVKRPGHPLTWERVVKLDHVGKRTVAKIKVHQRCYFAGETADATIATHNPTYKP